MQPKYLFINTIGCQMNVYDSEQIANVLKPLKYHLTSSLESADLIIVNTCTIRKKAEQKAFSFLGRLTGLKRKKPDLIVGIGGCVAQQEGEKLLDRLPVLDLVFGTHAIGRLPVIIEQIESKRCRTVDVDTANSRNQIQPLTGYSVNGKATSFVTIMTGCDNYCSYCVVPYVRGREVSRDPESILEEIRMLVESGVREVTLLGQNVNSYGKKKELCSFPQLLSRVNEIEGIQRIRFTTSHPKDLSDELIYGFKNLKKLCNHIHLPVQSGSNRVLKMMNRSYTREQYLEKVDKLRKHCPGIAITSDIIVGFPGETISDFEETLDLIKRIEYDSLFAFKYSDRPNVSATGFADKIPEADKKERLQKILELQDHYTVKKNRSFLGSLELLLVEGLSKKHSSGMRQPVSILKDVRCREVQWTGRTSTNKIVNFIWESDAYYCNNSLTGKMVEVRIEKSFSHSLWGKVNKIKPEPLGLKGEESYAA